MSSYVAIFRTKLGICGKNAINFLKNNFKKGNDGVELCYTFLQQGHHCVFECLLLILKIEKGKNPSFEPNHISL